MSRTICRLRTISRLAAGVSAAVLLSGCANGGPSFCTDDSADCIAARKARFTEMTADTSHAWTERKPTVVEYASGVRLFAYRQEQGRMSCPALKRGIAETGNARTVLTPKATEGISAERVGQIISLSEDVNRELTRTFEAKC